MEFSLLMSLNCNFELNICYVSNSIDSKLESSAASISNFCLRQLIVFEKAIALPLNLIRSYLEFP